MKTFGLDDVLGRRVDCLAHVYRPNDHLEDQRFWLKFLLDKVLSAVLLTGALPLIALIAVFIIGEGLLFIRAWGPVFVTDERITKGRSFAMWKFRTFKVPKAWQVVDDKPEPLVDDLAVTGVGHVLRRYYLDELPQLINILRGDMSFVGPRPVNQPMYESTLRQGYQCKRMLRGRLRRGIDPGPFRGGLCGPVQCMKGRWREFVTYLDLDEAMIGDYSRASVLGVVLFDMKIVGRTIRKVLDGDGMLPPDR